MSSLIIGAGVVTVLIATFFGFKVDIKLKDALNSFNQKFSSQDTNKKSSENTNTQDSNTRKLPNKKNQIHSTPKSPQTQEFPEITPPVQIKVPQKRNLTNVSNLDVKTVQDIEKETALKKLPKTTITTSAKLAFRKSNSTNGKKKTIQGTLDTLSKQNEIAKRNKIFKGTNNFSNPEFVKTNEPKPPVKIQEVKKFSTASETSRDLILRLKKQGLSSKQIRNVLNRVNTGVTE